ncbi:hypothetical protein PXH78_09290 [Mycolicibacterium smegmatis]|uniref:hypothetical protein n=1 Tax=Mycolicibacterium smegmatis TaxID=1772 RepID=UPI0005DA40C9|nr:hypothetical protein [Mycolicibacterium smegmatis]MDF1899061.1 hypothetical protein [Mycolicibacterium smegmatis]MDF1904885.1 hypothetical protein [Mycolicibacterium smegmatis]MDF1918754.1 hypothetical protein [Mycolicibacterium smegmatis]MDF1924049.1 hypothetical protein [Mycolicibacterium smegmatis]UAK53336.1 hypothetical protein K8P01_22345 [Mycolicibacterium smegmatis]
MTKMITKTWRRLRTRWHTLSREEELAVTIAKLLDALTREVEMRMTNEHLPRLHLANYRLMALSHPRRRR